MVAVNVEQLLEAISPESPCGEDLSYDPDYMELDRLARGTPEQQMGDEIVAAEEPNWKEVRDRCIALLSRTHDLRVAVYLVLALLQTDGVEGLRDGVCVLRRLLDQYWEPLHPALDTDDPDDPALERINIIAALSPDADTAEDPIKIIPRLMKTPLCESKRLGSFALRDVLICSGKLASGTEGEQPNAAEVDAAFADTAAEALQTRRQAIEDVCGHVKAVGELLVDHAGANKAPDLSRFLSTVQQVGKALDGYLAKRGYESTATEEVGMTPDDTQTGGVTAAPAAPAVASGTGEIRTADDVVKALDRVCQYYERNEPSSPVPLLVRRAQRLVGKSFVDIVRDVSPEAVKQVEGLGGLQG